MIRPSFNSNQTTIAHTVPSAASCGHATLFDVLSQGKSLSNVSLLHIGSKEAPLSPLHRSHELSVSIFFIHDTGAHHEIQDTKLS
jgi:hypothetical protein